MRGREIAPLGSRTQAFDQWIRGSFVAMFESRASTEPYNWRTYSNAPVRLWGFNELFNQGRFPPLTPRVMSYRRVDFNDIDMTTYNAVKASWGL